MKVREVRVYIKKLNHVEHVSITVLIPKSEGKLPRALQKRTPMSVLEIALSAKSHFEGKHVKCSKQDSILSKNLENEMQSYTHIGTYHCKV